MYHYCWCHNRILSSSLQPCTHHSGGVAKRNAKNLWQNDGLNTATTMAAWQHEKLPLPTPPTLLLHMVVLGELVNEVSIHLRVGVLAPGKVHVCKALHKLGVDNSAVWQQVNQDLLL